MLDNVIHRATMSHQLPFSRPNFFTFKAFKVNTLKSHKESPKVKLLSRVRLFATPWTVAHQAPQSMEFSRQEYWSGLPFPSPGDLPNLGIKPGSPALQADALPSEPPEKLNARSRLEKLNK